jgi:D-aminopeptidase
MIGSVTASSLGLAIATLPPGPLNAITDVAGVRVGHRTVTDPGNPAVQTGVTVVCAHGGNLFREKVVAACHVINGFGKSVGLLQIAELGQLESPIALTNTLSVPAATEGLLDHLLARCPEIGTTTGSANAVVCECNDSFLNDLRGRHVCREHVLDALASAASGPVEQGAVGAGRGMSAYGLKGGVGTASRIAETDGISLTIGVLVLSNLGRLAELTVAGRAVGSELTRGRGAGKAPDGGSLIAILATDAPVSSRQLGRLLRRVQNGIARTGSTTASGSGEIAIGFSTANRVPHVPAGPVLPASTIREDGPLIDLMFAAVTEASEEAILNSLFAAELVTGRDGNHREAFPVHRLDELLTAAEARKRA